ncbi:hypothetical protein [Rhodohalobacter sp.]|uniref:hypothetical protein n=1 Tax=Rhodohalobacter sp. TaxID=1974210 RepID=UPI002ACD63DB|nr:hypothetical protein [Rhodohalobacter sp.]MDZ7756352.1 hypothetical protein [Rhodohalobacter sp.]
MNEKYEQLIAEYLAGELDNEGKKKLEVLIAEGKIDFAEFREVEAIHEGLMDLSIPKPDEKMSERFYTMLEEEKSSNSIGLKQWMADQLSRLVESFSLPGLAYALVLIFIGGFFGFWLDQDRSQIDQLSQEMQSLKEIMMVNMLEGSSATDRLKAVNISTELPNADMEAVNALLFTLNNDPSVNVRVQTIEALKRWGDNERVRQGLVRSIATQESPIVLIELADAMTELELRSSAKEFEKVLQERELDYNVQQKLQSSIAVLM